VSDAIAKTRTFVQTLYGTAQSSVAKGRTLKETFADVRARMDGPYGQYAIYEHCLPFNVSRAYDEARGITWPVVWTADRDKAMWAELQG
jgi:hypothetical protein